MRPVALLGGTPWMITVVVELPMGSRTSLAFRCGLNQHSCCLGPLLLVPCTLWSDIQWRVRCLLGKRLQENAPGIYTHNQNMTARRQHARSTTNHGGEGQCKMSARFVNLNRIGGLRLRLIMEYVAGSWCVLRTPDSGQSVVLRLLASET